MILKVNVWERTLLDSKLPEDKNFVHLKETTCFFIKYFSNFQGYLLKFNNSQIIFSILLDIPNCKIFSNKVHFKNMLYTKLKGSPIVFIYYFVSREIDRCLVLFSPFLYKSLVTPSTTDGRFSHRSRGIRKIIANLIVLIVVWQRTVPLHSQIKIKHNTHEYWLISTYLPSRIYEFINLVICYLYEHINQFGEHLPLSPLFIS
ncbi:type I inositol 1,4,5-trisphosphate 5-phosphatase isoform X2 [Aphis craccivora]|uniref:Type I inositol 1,4,5-trisphosphate 5-phosphatase isoform X2 n=1 Tax=Aphis craccivora TaxID=307492 RepID=A0A6G0Z6U7_APHCR|nr:type I inositol 1,4,5-trisphosphate 5-phosphatase isoform X2 [Aphis craccivora]